jgi:UDP-2,4-diacetamido-2,4,6-trideoxy-beta-L-altropyranose hydrolase
VTSSPLLVVRADASEAIGSGHVMRCLAVAEQWRSRGGEVHFACQNLTGHLITEVQERGYPAHILPALEAIKPWGSTDVEADARATRGLMHVLMAENLRRPVWLLVDHYQIDDRWHEAVAQPGLRIAALDDLANRPLRCDVLIDQNSLSNLHHRYPSLTPVHCRHLLGADYTLLREDVQDAAKVRRASEEGSEVLIFLGGADNGRHTEEVVRQWKRQASGSLSAHVLCGSMNPQWEQLQSVCNEAQIECSRAQRGMAQVMGRARAAIVACGMLAVELQALEVPSLLIPLSDIQRAVAQDFRNRGRAVVLETEHLSRPETFDEAWARTLEMEHRPTGRGIIPLDGALRVVDALMEMQS